jgi:hypothetical protein
MTDLQKCLHLYLGCTTNKGVFVGIRDKAIFIQTSDNLTEEYCIQDIGKTVFLYLRLISNLTNEQSKQLITEGLVIGRPHGYTFTSYGFLYLLSLNVDLFGLINRGVAQELNTIE